MNFKTCLAVALAAVVATSVSAQGPYYCPAEEETGCAHLYSEANLAVSRDCRDDQPPAATFDLTAFKDCCKIKCGK
jgi:hypothetical protein